MPITTTLPNASSNPYVNGLTAEPGRDTPIIYTPGSTISYFFDTDVRAWSEAEKVAVRMAWDAWEEVINLTINETEIRADATVLMQISNLPDDVLAQASLPMEDTGTNETNVNTGLKTIGVGGDSYLTLVHEIGHNLGIYHPHNGNLFPGVPEGGEDVLGNHNANQNIWTIMSYNVGYDAEPVIDQSFGNAIGPMTLDIAAAQFAYGAKAAKVESNTYALPSQNIAGIGWDAIWDTGGTDTLSAAGISGSATIDLRAASLTGTDPGGHVSWVAGIKGGFTIANGVTIENAVGGNGDDTIRGNEADNQLTGGQGNDTIDGGGGQDTINMNGSRSGATVSLRKDGSIQITDRNGNDGSDLLTNVEMVQFNDSTLNLGQMSNATQLSAGQFTELAEVYVAYFNRAADAEGLYYWADKLALGMDMTTIANYFSQSAEARALYPNTDDTHAFVTAVYANVLGRKPDPEGFNFWKGTLDSGSVQPGTFVLQIIAGAKNGGNTADVNYLAAKANLGVYFSAIKGMSDVTDAQNVLNIFGDAATSNSAAAKAASDAHYADATAAGNGEFVLELVGVVNDPFAVA